MHACAVCAFTSEGVGGIGGGSDAMLESGDIVAEVVTAEGGVMWFEFKRLNAGGLV